MTTLALQLSNLITRIGTEFKSVRNAEGNLADLSTTAKSSLVAALNELKAAIDTISGSSGASINDSSAGTTTTYSSQKVIDLIATAKAAVKSEILNGADAAHDTLIEIQALLNGEAADIATILTAVGNRVRFDAAQTLTAPEQAQARANIGAQDAASIGDTQVDLTAAFVTALS